MLINEVKKNTNNMSCSKEIHIAKNSTLVQHVSFCFWGLTARVNCKIGKRHTQVERVCEPGRHSEEKGLHPTHSNFQLCVVIKLSLVSTLGFSESCCHCVTKQKTLYIYSKISKTHYCLYLHFFTLKVFNCLPKLRYLLSHPV